MQRRNFVATLIGGVCGFFVPKVAAEIDAAVIPKQWPQEIPLHFLKHGDAALDGVSVLTGDSGRFQTIAIRCGPNKITWVDYKDGNFYAIDMAMQEGEIIKYYGSKRRPHKVAEKTWNISFDKLKKLWPNGQEPQKIYSRE